MGGAVAEGALRVGRGGCHRANDSRASFPASGPVGIPGKGADRALAGLLVQVWLLSPDAERGVCGNRRDARRDLRGRSGRDGLLSSLR